MAAENLQPTYNSVLYRRAHIAGVLVFISGLSVLLLNALDYMPFLADDSLISLRYAERLLQGHGLTFNDSEFVEGYSNLLWILLVSLPGFFRADLITSARVLGFVCSASALFAVYFAFPPVSWRRVGILAVLTAFFSISGGIAIWTIGGLEQPLVIALLSWIAALFIRERKLSVRISVITGILGGLLCISRPDTPLFVAAMFAGLFFMFGPCRKTFYRGIVFAGTGAAFYIAQLVFRLSYYGEWFPNTAYVKISPSMNHYMAGVDYLLSGAQAILPCLAAFIVLSAACIRIRSSRGTYVFLLLPVAAWCSYLVFIGGGYIPRIQAYGACHGPCSVWDRAGNG